MEVGWYLRLSRAPRVEALVAPEALPAMEDQRAINPSWTLRTEPVDGGWLRVVFTRQVRERLEESEGGGA
jgi:hypothetical protein